MEAARKALVELLTSRRELVIARSTDWATGDRADVAPSRTKPQVRKNFERYLDAQIDLLATGNASALEEFMRFVTDLQSQGEFRMSTMMRACFSLRNGVADVLRLDAYDPTAALAILDAADHAVQNAAIVLSDMYTEVIHRSLIQRRTELETQLNEVTKQQIESFISQQNAMNTMTSPIVEVWHGILVAPLIGEYDGERMAQFRDRVAERIVASGSPFLLLDLTGLSVLDSELAGELGRLVGCVRLLGAEAMLVGVTPAVAVALAALDAHEADKGSGRVASYATLHAGLRAALRRQGLHVAGLSNPPRRV